MGAPSAQVQSSQTSRPASKGAGQSASSEPGSGKGGQISSMSGQPTMGQPNTNGNTDLAPINPGLSQDSPRGKGGQSGGYQSQNAFVSGQDGPTPANPYPNTVGQWDNQSTKSPAGLGKGA